MFDLSPQNILSRIIILLIAFPVHEFAHAFTANAFGDETPRSDGRLTLNPAVHLDLMGSVLLIFAGFGWARPVQVNPYVLRQKSKSALMWVSLAGPFSNLLLAILASIPIKYDLVPVLYEQGGLLPTPYEFLIQFIIINLLLMVFNLIPLAPLDGEKVLEFFLPPAGVELLNRLRPYGSLILLLVFLILPRLGFNLLGLIFEPVLSMFAAIFIR